MNDTREAENAPADSKIVFRASGEIEVSLPEPIAGGSVDMGYACWATAIFLVLNGQDDAARHVRELIQVYAEARLTEEANANADE